MKIPRKVHNKAYRSSYDWKLSIFECAVYYKDTLSGNIYIDRYLNYKGIVVMYLCFPISWIKRGRIAAVSNLKCRKVCSMVCLVNDTKYNILMGE